MKAELIPEHIYTMVHLQPDGRYARIGKWYTRRGDAQRILDDMLYVPSKERSNYYVMAFDIKEGELVENSNSQVQ